MDTVTLSKKDFEEIKKELIEIKTQVKKITVPNEAFIDNHQFEKLMQVSYRTAHAWRKAGKIGYSQAGKKIYYRLSDIGKFLENYHHEPFAMQKKIEEVTG